MLRQCRNIQNTCGNAATNKTHPQKTPPTPHEKRDLRKTKSLCRSEKAVHAPPMSRPRLHRPPNLYAHPYHRRAATPFRPSERRPASPERLSQQRPHRAERTGRGSAPKLVRHSPTLPQDEGLSTPDDARPLARHPLCDGEDGQTPGSSHRRLQGRLQQGLPRAAAAPASSVCCGSAATDTTGSPPSLHLRPLPRPPLLP